MRQNRTGQFGWVVLLLATAVILPTVCLLWFMTQAVRNERLAVRQKLVDVYTERSRKLVNIFPNEYMDKKRDVVGSLDRWPELSVPNFCMVTGADSCIVFDSGKVYSPLLLEQADSTSTSAAFAAAEKMEFLDGDCDKALNTYLGLLPTPTSANAVEVEQVKAQVAASRCLRKLGRIREAVSLLEEAAYPEYPVGPETVSDVMRARVLLAQMYLETKDDKLMRHMGRVLRASSYDDETVTTQLGTMYPSDVDAWMLRKLVSIAQEAGLAENLKDEIYEAQSMASTQELAIQAVAVYPDIDALGQWPIDTIRRLNTKETLYGTLIPMPQWGEHKVLYIMAPSRLVDEHIKGLMEDISTDTIVCHILDDKGTMVAGTAADGEPFATMSLGRWMPEWKLELHFKDTSVFEDAAKKRAAVYVWAAILVISLIGGVAIASGVSINRQMRLNRLKNDFIATITHELKTPLSSMRVLVDTLLAGDCKDEGQEKEYLELIARENLRLSRLIDNFLTFSRMERNKKAFDIQPCKPEEIVADAAEAVKTKFEKNGCVFEHDVAGSLPEVMADHDAVVTVLVNLLDNACKYSGRDKRISLKAFARNGQVCFEVSDNGYGMTKKVMRRIFERFYQADQSLSRSAEGCGLGLSIVKFIVDAHDGRIDVRSRPGEGSCFTVRLPAAGCGQS